MEPRRVIILDFDFFSTVGGGQTFYRRVVERHPATEFWYPSRGPDCRAAGRKELPENARPFVFDRFEDKRAEPLVPTDDDWQNLNAVLLAQIAVALQGLAFEVVEVPSFFPVAQLVYPVFDSFGIVAGGITQGLLGWQSVGLRNGYDPEAGERVADAVQKSEARSVAAADVTYAISDLHIAENIHYAPELLIDMRDALEEFPIPPADPPGKGLPDLWFVGRLDRNKGPDLFLRAAARLPRGLFRRCCFAGPDNAAWSPRDTWSETLLRLADDLGIDARYAGELEDEALRTEVYRGRAVLLVTSRSDAFNYVALEALANGCPVILSKHAGAADYLAARYPHIAPVVIDPEDVDATAAAAEEILSHYEEAARRLRSQLREQPLPKPQQGFMYPVFNTAMERAALRGRELSDAGNHPLLGAMASHWRPQGAGRARAATVVVTVRDDASGLAATLASIRRLPSTWSIIVVDDGSSDPRPVRDVVRSFEPAPVLYRQGQQGPMWAANCGWLAADDGPICFLAAGDLLDPDFDAECERIFADRAVIAWAVPWSAMADLRFDGGENPALGPLVVRRETLERANGFRVDIGDKALNELVERLRGVGRLVDGQGRTLVWRPAEGRRSGVAGIAA